MKLVYWTLAMAALGSSAAVPAAAADETDKGELRKSLKDLDEAASWVYDDLDSAFASAKKSGKPLLIVFR